MGKKLDKHLALAKERLETGEVVFAAIFGFAGSSAFKDDLRQGSVLAATDRRIILYAKSSRSHEMAEFSYDQITNLEVVKRKLELHASGQWCKITLVDGDLEAFELAVRDRMNDRAARPAADSEVSEQSVADELTKFAALVQQGLMTREEFERQKARLLG
ncbi:SHOCT domain-containing protein [Glycomyces xiaoerkulensis]|uniref:SHOCT domain-containing protein n=1 Tax=Glycomyces xiaoerkulensis TaxID=2038139 RepID=UPI000C25706C|nr:SHOCT domain-containing protein [Glycomyces xiaoerkulensis]